MERFTSHEVFDKLGQKLAEFRAAIEDRKSSGDTHLSFVHSEDLTLEDAEIFEKLNIGKLSQEEYEQMASESRALGQGTTRPLFYEFIGNELTKQQLSQ